MGQDMTDQVRNFQRLCEDNQLQRAAAEAFARDGERAVLRLRKDGVEADLASSAVSLAQLREKAKAKFGDRAADMFFTRDGLEQATRFPVAQARAARLAALGSSGIGRSGNALSGIDLCCGIGTESIALALSGVKTTGVELNPLVAAMAQANAVACGVEDLFEVQLDDALSVSFPVSDNATGLIGVSDPARRSGSSRRFNPDAYMPPLGTVMERLATGTKAAALKVGPGIDHEWLDQCGFNLEAEWVSVNGDVVEACLWLGEAAVVPRRASLYRDGLWHEMSGEASAPVDVHTDGTDPVGMILYEPDGAVIRSGLVGQLAQQLHTELGHAGITYLYGDEIVSTPFAKAWRVVERVGLKPKQITAALRAKDIGSLTIKQRGSGIDPQIFRKKLKLEGSQAGTIVLTRWAGEHCALIVEDINFKGPWEI